MVHAMGLGAVLVNIAIALWLPVAFIIGLVPIVAVIRSDRDRDDNASPAAFGWAAGAAFFAMLAVAQLF